MEYELTRSWWALALRGVFAILFGILAFVWPGLTVEVLVLLWGAYALVDGVFALAAVAAGYGRAGQWWALLLEGFVGIVVGLLTFVWPGITAVALVYVIASWAIATGIFEIVAAIRLRKYIRGEWLLALSGILSVLLGLGLFIAPGAGALVLVLWIGAYAIVFGVLLLALAFQLRSMAPRGVAGGIPRPAGL
jgi:uncharacterized membrane protein HdeD (DUF308 family)